jgi:hypothetical protein
VNGRDLAITVARAQLYSHGPTEEDEAASCAHLSIEHLNVDADVLVDGMVTLSAGRDDCDEACYSFEFDLPAEEARRLAVKLVAAADRARRPPGASTRPGPARTH